MSRHNATRTKGVHEQSPARGQIRPFQREQSGALTRARPSTHRPWATEPQLKSCSRRILLFHNKNPNQALTQSPIWKRWGLCNNTSVHVFIKIKEINSNLLTLNWKEFGAWKQTYSDLKHFSDKRFYKTAEKLKLNQNWKIKKPPSRRLPFLRASALLSPDAFSPGQQEESPHTPVTSSQWGKKGCILPDLVRGWSPPRAPSPEFKDGHAVFWDMVEV